MHSGIFDVLAPADIESWVIKKEYFIYEPFNQSSLDYSDLIRIPVNSNDKILHIADSDIEVSGKILKADGSAAGTSQAIMGFAGYLFDALTLKCDGVDLDSTRNLGLWSHVRNKVVPTYSEYRALQQASFGDQTQVFKDKEFSVSLPLKQFSGFAEDYNKIIINQTMELQLLRARNDKNALLSTTNDNATDKIKLSRIRWIIPGYLFNDAGKLEILELMNRDAIIEVPFRQIDVYELELLDNTKDSRNIMTTSVVERPRFVFIVFQTAKANDQLKDNSKLDHCNILDLRLYINNQPQTNISLDCEWDKHQVQMAYRNYCQAHKNFFGNVSTCEPVLTYEEFRNSPIFCFDTGRAMDVLAGVGGAADIRFEYVTGKDKIPAGTRCYVFVGREKKFVYNITSGNLRPSV